MLVVGSINSCKNMASSLEGKLMGLTLTEAEEEVVECIDDDEEVVREQIQQPSEIVFESIRLWVKVEDVPFEKRKKSMAMAMAQKMGKFVEYDESDPIGWSKYMRIRVDLPLDKPLRRGMWMMVGNCSKWVKFKYERLMDFCYVCGLFGHGYRDCSVYDDRMAVGELPYGGWMGASPTKRRRGNEYKKEEEKKLCSDLKMVCLI